MPEDKHDRLITSKEILHKTGISRATLNNYIKVGILPKPVVKKPGDGQERTRQIGYFPVDALDRIALVRRLKREGNPMAVIIGMMGGSMDMNRSVPENERTIEDASDDKARARINLELFPARSSSLPLSEKPNEPSTKTESVPPLNRRSSDLHLTISDIYSPAYMVNHHGEIEWINEEAEKEVFGRNIDEIKKVDARNIFKLFFGWEFQNHMRNWQEAISCHMAIMSPTIKKSSLASFYPDISKSEVQLLEKSYVFERAVKDLPLADMPIKLIRSDGTAVFYQLYAMYFREGVFFVYMPAEGVHHDLMRMLKNRGKVINELLKNRMPSLVSLCVLVADLQDSVRISAELPPHEYFQLINELWRTVGISFDKYNGIYGKHAGDGMLYYFPKRPGTNYLTDAINCSLDLRESMKKLNSEWRLKKGWKNDLFLNIAINEGQEFFGAIHSASNVEFTALGDSINFTGRLSDFARNGSIWTTKNVITKLNPEDQNRLRYGIRGRGQESHHTVYNSFSRIIDFMGETNSDYAHFADIATLPVTEIFGQAGQSTLPID